MSRSSFSKAYKEITFTINDADLDKLYEICNDINVNECPWFEVRDKHGNKAKYYREPHWIPCSERPPEESGKYIVTAYDGNEKRTSYAQYQKRVRNWVLSGQRAYWKVIAWMPLPEPYKEEGEQE